MTSAVYGAMIAAELTHAEHAALSALARADGPRSIGQIAAATKADEYHLRRVLRALVGRKILASEQSAGARCYSVNDQVSEWK